MKIAVVTGCSSGIGAAIAENFLKNGWKVYGVSRTQPQLSQPDFIWRKADLTKREDINHCILGINEDRIDLLVNDAGVAFKVPGVKLSAQSFHKIFDLNVLAPVYMVAALRTKLSNGLVINFSSTSDRVPEKGYALYCSSKAALNIYFDVLALEKKSVKFINILPDYVDTPLLRKEVGDEAFDWKEAVTVQQVAAFIYVLSQRHSAYPTGARIMILNNATIGSFTRKEKLFAYNADTKLILTSK
jgi:NAD(P)-dependent dehydrogenase (short-subunit alcohol dehydrogenase family)